MNWFYLSILAQLLWSISNFVDKYLMNRYFKTGSVGALAIFLGLVDIVFAPIVLLLDNHVLSFPLFHILILLTFGVILIFAYILYSYALQGEEASVVIPLFQMIPVISYFLGLIFLHETLTLRQIIASLIVVFGAIVISLDLSNTIPKIKAKVLLFTFIFCLLFSITAVGFKYFAIKDSFWATTFWVYLGSGLGGLGLFLFVKSYRQTVIKLLSKKALIL